MSLSLLALCFFIIAILYSTAGFGGGSSYIAILLLANLPFEDVRWIALICNVVVVSTSCWYFYKADILKPKKLLPLIILSIPLAFFGGTFRPETNTFKIVAAIALIGASVLMIIDHKKIEKKILSSPILSGIGGAIGLLSGFIGIGGGIFLSPVLHIIRWESAKVISAAASFFILVNSLAGLVGQSLNNPYINSKICITLGLSVFVGGQIGNKLNIHILSPEKIKLVSAVLIAFVGFRILYTQLF
jgi:uncharacterized membrane protein YfcA